MASERVKSRAGNVPAVRPCLPQFGADVVRAWRVEKAVQELSRRPTRGPSVGPTIGARGSDIATQSTRGCARLENACVRRDGGPPTPRRPRAPRWTDCERRARSLHRSPPPLRAVCGSALGDSGRGAQTRLDKEPAGPEPAGREQPPPPSTSPRLCKFTGGEHATTPEPVRPKHFSRPSFSARCATLRRAGGRAPLRAPRTSSPRGGGLADGGHRNYAQRKSIDLQRNRWLSPHRRAR